MLGILYAQLARHKRRLSMLAMIVSRRAFVAKSVKSNVVIGVVKHYKGLKSEDRHLRIGIDALTLCGSGHFGKGSLPSGDRRRTGNLVRLGNRQCEHKARAAFDQSIQT